MSTSIRFPTVVRRALVPGLLALLALGATASAQAVPDSMPLWALAMRSGTLEQRDAALARLSGLPPESLTPEARGAIVAELVRLHESLLASGQFPGNETGEMGEFFADYYMQLVSTVAAIRTPEAALALAPAVGVSGGVARRVARLGDPAVGALLPLLARGWGTVSVLNTLGLVWFWADSTGSTLSDDSRADIVSALTTAAASDSVDHLFGLIEALDDAAEPAFLPLAITVRDRQVARGTPGALYARELSTQTIPRLSALASSRPIGSAFASVSRMIASVCRPSARLAGSRLASARPGRRGLCQAITSQLSSAQREFDAGKADAARSKLDDMIHQADVGLARGAISAIERELLVGNVIMLAERLPR